MIDPNLGFGTQDTRLRVYFRCSSRRTKVNEKSMLSSHLRRVCRGNTKNVVMRKARNRSLDITLTSTRSLTPQIQRLGVQDSMEKLRQRDHNSHHLRNGDDFRTWEDLFSRTSVKKNQRLICPQSKNINHCLVYNRLVDSELTSVMPERYVRYMFRVSESCAASAMLVLLKLEYASLNFSASGGSYENSEVIYC